MTNSHKFKIPVLMLKTITFEFLTRKVINENKFHYSVLKSSCY